MRIYVGGISFNSNTDGLRDLFATVGTVTDATIVEDKYSGQSKGFGFVKCRTLPKRRPRLPSLMATRWTGAT